MQIIDYVSISELIRSKDANEECHMSDGGVVNVIRCYVLGINQGIKSRNLGIDKVMNTKLVGMMLDD